uniref:Uncharacterized protein n=1 Tax=Setaria viridis TaxID=4556 RepID=A0A4U6W1M4_SETVI|nr:hypothetical protein SEVIR_2G434001v2 [Setaria viridis]
MVVGWIHETACIYIYIRIKGTTPRHIQIRSEKGNYTSKKKEGNYSVPVEVSIFASRRLPISLCKSMVDGLPRTGRGEHF